MQDFYLLKQINKRTATVSQSNSLPSPPPFVEGWVNQAYSRLSTTHSHINQSFIWHIVHTTYQKTHHKHVQLETHTDTHTLSIVTDK